MSHIVKPTAQSWTGQRYAEPLVQCTALHVGDIIQLARNFIYKLGRNVAGAAVERLLFAHSWVPNSGVSYCRICFAMLMPDIEYICRKAWSFGFDPFVMLVVDLMHEFELGIWKAIFAHLVRLLYAAGPGGSIGS